MSKGLYVNSDILSLSQFDRPSIDRLLRNTKKIIALSNKNKCSNVLKGSVIALLFFEPSTRTFNSFSAAAQRLGAGVIELRDISVTSITKGETFEDTVRIYDSYADLIVMRHPKEGSAVIASGVAKVPVVNAGDGANEHPTQTLLDLFTIKSKFGRLSNLKILFAGDLLNGRTVRSLLQGLSFYDGNEICLLSPQQLRLDPKLVNNLRKRMKITEINNEAKIPKGFHVWYWTRIQKERFKSKKQLSKIKKSFVVTKKLLESKAAMDTIIMHPLPRVGEIAEEVDSDPRAIYFQQVRNGLYVRMALLAMILNKL